METGEIMRSRHFGEDSSGESFRKDQAVRSEGKVQKSFVMFYSPGTFVSETSEKAIDFWDVEKAVNGKGNHGASRCDPLRL